MKTNLIKYLFSEKYRKEIVYQSERDLKKLVFLLKNFDGQISLKTSLNDDSINFKKDFLFYDKLEKAVSEVIKTGIETNQIGKTKELSEAFDSYQRTLSQFKEKYNLK